MLLLLMKLTCYREFVAARDAADEGAREAVHMLAQVRQHREQRRLLFPFDRLDHVALVLRVEHETAAFGLRELVLRDRGGSCVIRTVREG